MQAMLLTFDSSADALYIYLQRGARVARSVLMDDDRTVDLDHAGRVVGIEVLSPSNGIEVSDIIQQFGLDDVKEELLQAVGEFRPSAAV